MVNLEAEKARDRQEAPKEEAEGREEVGAVGMAIADANWIESEAGSKVNPARQTQAGITITITRGRSLVVNTDRPAQLRDPTSDLVT